MLNIPGTAHENGLRYVFLRLKVINEKSDRTF